MTPLDVVSSSPTSAASTSSTTINDSMAAILKDVPLPKARMKQPHKIIVTGKFICLGS